MLRDVGKKVSGVLSGPRDEGGAVTDDPDAGTPGAPLAPPPDQEDPITAPVAPPSLEVDPRCAAALDLARAAAGEVAGPAVGAHLGVEAEDERVVTHSFATTEPAYVGWRWAVTVARADGSDVVTVDDVVLLPGSGALLAPAWVPWSERVQPDDLSPGDLLPPAPDDPRLVPSYADVDAEPLPFDLHRELGLGRPRVLSRDGRADAAERWYDGPGGPDTPVAKAAPGRCADCGFLAPLAGQLGLLFGACANAMAPDDGRVVALTHGCGAHSETVVEPVESTYAGMAVEDDEFEVVDRSEAGEAAEGGAGEGAAAGAVEQPAGVGAADSEPAVQAQTDAGQTDAGQTDAGQTDAGQTDAGQTDAAAADGSGALGESATS